MSQDIPGEAVSPGVIEIRPVRPAGKLLPFEQWYLENWRLTADAGTGTLTLSGDKYLRHKSHVFPLASPGRADGVTKVCLAVNHWVVGRQSGSAWRMLLLDREERLVWAGWGRDHPQVLRIFPPEVFEPLKSVGLRVVSEWYETARALDDAHPGAVGKVALTGERPGKMAAIGISIGLLLVIVVAVAVYFTR